MTAPQTAIDFGAPRHIWFSPVRFFRARLARPPRPAAALAPLLAYVAVTSAAVLVVSVKTRRISEAALERAGLPLPGPAWAGDLIAVTASVTTGFFLFAASALAVLALDMLFSQSGRGRRLVEFTALSYYCQLPFAVVWLGIVAWAWQPAPLRLPPGTTAVELLDLLRAYQESAASTALLSTARLFATYFWCWFVILQAVALRVAAGFTVGGAWAAGASLATLFVAAPDTVDRLW